MSERSDVSRNWRMSKSDSKTAGRDKGVGRKTDKKIKMTKKEMEKLTDKYSKIDINLMSDDSVIQPKLASDKLMSSISYIPSKQPAYEQMSIVDEMRQKVEKLTKKDVFKPCLDDDVQIIINWFDKHIKPSVDPKKLQYNKQYWHGEMSTDYLDALCSRLHNMGFRVDCREIKDVHVYNCACYKTMGSWTICDPCNEGGYSLTVAL
jgi:hypothetical protein